MRKVVVQWKRTRLLAFALVGSFAASCNPDLGECDMTMLGGSENVAMPMPHAGQLVVQQNCVNCHSVKSKGAQRVGAPAELDFDVVPVNTSAEEIAVARAGQSVVFDNRESMWGAIEGGSMPPGPPAGRGELSAADKETVRNWLACGAPVIATPAVIQGGEDWNAIYEAFVGPGGLACEGCHGANPLAGDGFMLGMTGDACAAYGRVVNARAVTTSGTPIDCASTMQSLVVPNSPEMSLLLHKLEGTHNCGMAMPFGAALGPNHPLVMDLRAWIMAGAPKPANCP